ncbi:Alpha/Beta hydrolase fold [Russula decolorans]
MGDTVMKETLNVAGLLTNIYARSNHPNSSPEPVVVLFFLHGRGENADSVDSTARAAFAWVDEKQASSSKRSPTPPPRDFIVVTFDQRNHGQRTVDKRGNQGWSRKPEEHNERHAQVSAAGAVKDLSFLIDILPAYLFPNDERTIGEWVLAGFSLGGHATWLALRHEPRIRIGIPICGCPDYLALMEQRAEHLGIPRTPSYFPASLRALVRANDTVPATATAFAGKRMLVLAGADDKLVPWETSRTFVEALDVGRGGRKVVMVVPGVKHEFTDGMKEEMLQFFWEEALVRGAAVLNCAL